MQHPEHSDALQNWVLGEVVDNMNVNIYATDIQNDRILFMNKAMKKAFGLEKPEGEICWKVLQRSRDHRCEFCPIDTLVKRKGGEPVIWEEHNSLNGRLYENCDSLARWSDGRIVHLQQSLDITEMRRLSQAARVDELTGLLNRRAGKEALDATLATARNFGQTVCVCMFDLNCLKEVNDRFGHGEGDRYIASAARRVQTMLQKAEYAVRRSGDEFIVVFPDAGEAEAERRMAACLESLKQEGREQKKPYEMGFCYGIVEVAPDRQSTQQQILTEADDRMYHFKRRYHLASAWQEKPKQPAAPAELAVLQGDAKWLCEALSQSTEDYLYVCDWESGAFRYPPAMVEEFGLPGEVVPNAAAVWGEKIHPEDKDAFLEANQEIADGRCDSHCVEYRAKNRRGEWVWLRCRGHLERDDTGKPTLFAGFITNLGKRNRVDALTGLYNRVEFSERVGQLLRGRQEIPIWVLMLGLDGFRRINEQYDRAFGDEVLRAAAHKIQNYLPHNASAYRSDGDEFFVLFLDGDEGAVRRFYTELQRDFSQRQSIGGRGYRVTISGGCACAPLHAGNDADLIRCALHSLQCAKANGRNRLVTFSDRIVRSVERSQQIQKALYRSVDQGCRGFSIVFQPQIDAVTGRIAGAEALARFTDSQLGPVPPDEFIPVLESTGLIHPVGRFIMNKALLESRSLLGRPGMTLSVNLSYLQLENPDFLPFMENAAQETKIDPQRIVLELTESCIASNLDLLSSSLERLRAAGIRIAMDDFGIGYSSLGLLRNCPVDMVKVDRSFVRGIQSSPFDAAFIRSIADLCRGMGIAVCIEGIETQEQQAILKDIPVNLWQGFLFGRPMPADELETFVDQGKDASQTGVRRPVAEPRLRNF